MSPEPLGQAGSTRLAGVQPQHRAFSHIHHFPPAPAIPRGWRSVGLCPGLCCRAVMSRREGSCLLPAAAISKGLFHTSSCAKVTDQMFSVSSQVLVHFKLDLSPAVKTTFSCSQGREIHSSGGWERSLAGKGMNAVAEGAML